MRNHVLRPLWVVMAAVVLLLVVRHFLVPDDFGVHGASFTYNFYRLGNVDDWKNFKVKYRGREYCRQCHAEKLEQILSSAHQIIECENCHDPAIEHPDDPETMTKDTSRLLCLRCHAALPYPQSDRARLPAVSPQDHNPGAECVECHNPHDPGLGVMQ